MQKDPAGRTPLQNVAWQGHADIVKLLLSKGAEPNRASSMDYTALIFAAFSGHVDVMELLIERGAEVSARADNDVTPFLAAAASSNPSAVRLLIHSGADVGARDARGNTPLMFAAATGNVETIDILLEAGASIDERSQDGYDPIGFARLYEQEAVVTRLGGGPAINGFADATTMKSGVSPPTLDKPTPAEFTDDAVHRGIDGNVLLTVVISESGRVGDVRVTTSLGIGLDLNAIECVREWEFTPGFADGEAVDVVVEIEISFELL